MGVTLDWIAPVLCICKYKYNVMNLNGIYFRAIYATRDLCSSQDLRSGPDIMGEYNSAKNNPPIREIGESYEKKGAD